MRRVGPWTLLEPLSPGGQGRVYRAVDDQGLLVALKLGSRLVLGGEADALGRLDHPGVVRLVGVDLDATVPWLATAWVDGRPLEVWIRRPPPPGAWVLRMARALTGTLLALHQAGLTHGDLKPEHALVNDLGLPVLVDLGLATHPGQGGTPAYAPPEWFAGAVADPTLVDAYALGVVLYELLTGVRAPRAPRKTSLDPGLGIDPFLRSLVGELTAPSPHQRRSVVATASLLVRLGSEQPTGATLPGAPPRAEPAPTGQIGPWRLQEVLGRGGMAVVYRAWDTRSPGLGQVALKVLATPSPDARQRLLQEAQALRRLEHPHVVPILDQGQDQDRAWVAMPFLSGGTLSSLLGQRGPLPPEQASELVAQVASALSAAHAEGLVHRDVKLSNVLLDQQGRALLSDFGLARDLSAEHTRLTTDGQVLGTPAAMSPEQARGAEVGPPTDVWALGVLLYELLTGEPPFPGTHPAQVLHAVLTGPPPSLRRRAPPELAQLVSRCLAAEPVHRPTAAQVAMVLVAAAEGRRVSLPGLPLEARLSRLRPGRLGWVAVGAAALLLLGAGGVSLGRSHWTERQAESQLEALLAQVEAWSEQPDRAWQAVEHFAREPGLAGTSAPARAWLGLGDALESWQQREEARAAWSHAYAQAEGGDRDEALARLAVVFREEGDWPRLDLVSRLVDADRPSLAHARQQLALAQRQAPKPGHGAADLASHLLTHATPTPWSDLRAVHLAADGSLLLLGREQNTVVEAEPGLGLRHTCPSRSGGWHAMGSAQDPAWLVSEKKHSEVVRCLPDQTPMALEWSGSRVQSVLTLGTTTWVGTGSPDWRLLLLEQGPDGTWSWGPPHAETELWRSAVHDLERCDADGDGEDELLAALGAWRAYDLRVLELRPEGPVRTARLPLGRLDRATCLGPGRMAALTLPLYRNAQLFPEPPHWPAPPGLHLVSWRDGGLVLDESLSPARELSCKALRRGHLDDDGLVDLVLRCGSQTHLARQTADGSVDLSLLSEDLQVHEVVDLDGDGTHEILATDQLDGRLWVLGLGSSSLPEAPVEPLEVGQPPPEAGALAELWQRAEDLHTLGEHQVALSLLEDLAARSTGTPLAGQALLRGAQVASAAGHIDAALGLLSEAEDQPGIRSQARRERVDLLRARLRLAEARDGARDYGWTEEVAALEAELGPAPVSLEVSELSQWRVLEPLQVRPAPGGGLRITGTDAVVLERRVRWEGHPVSMELTAEVERLSMGGSLQLSLQPVGGESTWGLRVAGRGGGGLLHLSTNCLLGDYLTLGESWLQAWPGGAQATSSNLMDVTSHLRLHAAPAEGRLYCDVQGQPEVHGVHQRQEPGVYLLQVRSRYPGEGAWHDVVFSDITLRGLIPVDTEPVHQDPAWVELAMGHPDRALTLLQGRPPTGDTELLRAAALTQLSRVGEARQALASALGRPTPPRAEWVRHLLRAHPGSFDDVVRRSDGPEAFTERVYTVWQDLLEGHPDDPELHRALVTAVPDLLDQGWASDPEARHRRALLLLGRARGLQALHRWDEAEAHLEAVEALPSTSATDEALRAQVAAVRAQGLLDRGLVEGARRALVQGVERAKAPELVRATYRGRFGELVE